ncbi:iron ABC transporter permease [Paenibacillus eucommiae]|uniref:Iron complex transport system permease protein n=1 Tax=Paenibacillus eucommiae TaxID=1355755 RepID=A0ABS4IXG5_9BACL|nr:iron ABC transporter permease [Paenibacillus eucommiae]MBP1991696.1 iron complex transport system permease protein [Paenibacillus eucommiae]
MICIFGGGFVALGILFFVSLCFGEAKIPVQTVIDALLHNQGLPDHNIVWDLRMPRTILGLLTGAGLALAGTLLQTITKNPLASTDTLGINSGAYFMVVLGTAFFPGILSVSPLTFAAVGGAMAATIAYLLGGGKMASPLRLVLAGMIVSLVIESFTRAIHIFKATETQNLFLWGAGSLVQVDWDGVFFAWPWVLGMILLAILLGKQFDVLTLDEATARSLGQKVDWTRLAGLALAVLVASVVVSVVGPIGFVGLVAPHLIRLMGLRKHGWLIPGAALWGAVLITAADVLSRVVRSNVGEMPIGAVMAIIGAPWLVWLVLSKMKGTTGSVGQMSMQAGGRFVHMSFNRMAVIMFFLVVALILVSMTMGGTQIPLGQLFSSLFGSSDASSYSTLLNLRLPRTFVAAGAGIALAVSGVLIQAAVRNPLADASIIGVTSGAGFGAMLILIAWPQVPVTLLPVAAIAGGLTAAACVFLLAWRKGLHPFVLILLGIAVSAFGSAGIQALIVRGSLWGSSGYIWLTGSTYGRTWQQVALIAIFLVVLLPIALYLARRFDLLAFGDDSATGLGLAVRKTRLAAMIVGVLLAAGAVASIGTVGFLGLIVPHAVRMLIGHHTRQSIVLSGLLGALLLVMTDAIGRTILAPKEIPSGLLITLIGAPYFLFLMIRTFRRKS